MAIDPPPPDPDRERLEALIAFSRKRVERIDAKLADANADRIAAVEQLERDQAALKRWLEEHPPAQPDLF